MTPQRGDIYWLPFGQEGKERPVLIVSRDPLNEGDYVVVVPFTTQQLERRRTSRSCVSFSAGQCGLTKDCVVKADEISRALKNEINWQKGRLGRLLAPDMAKVVRAIRYVIRDDELE